MTSRTTQRFRDCFAALPGAAQQQARAAYRRFRENSRQPGLRFKRVHASEPIYSVRITRDYRALGVLDGDQIIWFWVGKHDEYEKIVRQLARA